MNIDFSSIYLSNFPIPSHYVSHPGNMDELPDGTPQQLFRPLLITQSQISRLDDIEESIIELTDFTEDEHLPAAIDVLLNLRQIQQVRVNLNFFARHANSPSYSSRRLQPFFRQKGRLPFVEQFSMSPRHMTIFRSNVSAITLEGCSHMNSCMFL